MEFHITGLVTKSKKQDETDWLILDIYRLVSLEGHIKVKHKSSDHN